MSDLVFPYLVLHPLYRKIVTLNVLCLKFHYMRKRIVILARVHKAQGLRKFPCSLFYSSCSSLLKSSLSQETEDFSVFALLFKWNKPELFSWRKSMRQQENWAWWFCLVLEDGRKLHYWCCERGKRGYGQQ